MNGIIICKARDGFIGTPIGTYITREGQEGIVLQQVGTNVVHVYRSTSIETIYENGASDELFKNLPLIETAPHDRSEILLVSIQPQHDGMTYVSISNGSWSDEHQIFVLGPKGSHMNSVGDSCATHWLPMSWLSAVGKKT